MGAKSKPGLNKCNAWWHSNSTFCNMDTMYIAINCELYSNRQKNVKWPMLVTDSRFKWKSGKILQIPKQVILDSPVTWLAFRVAIEGTAQFFFIDKEEYFVFAPRRVYAEDVLQLLLASSSSFCKYGLSGHGISR